MLLAVLDKRSGYSFSTRDVFINVAGGLNVSEPAADIAVIVALMSGLRDKPIGKMAFIGELGLTGEIRGVSQIEQRVREAEKFGFVECIVPKVNASRITSANCRIHPVKTIEDVLELVF